MEVKKSPKADLEGKKSTWLLIGYVFILALMFVAFEWTDRDKQVTTETGITDVVFEEEIIPITEQEQKQAPPPPEAPKVEEVLQIVENDAKVEETAIQASEETGQAVEVKYVPVEVEEEEPEEDAEDDGVDHHLTQVCECGDAVEQQVAYGQHGKENQCAPCGRHGLSGTLRHAKRGEGHAA